MSQITQKLPTDEIDKALNGSNKIKRKRSKKLTIRLSMVSVLVIGVLIGGIYGFNKFFNIPNVTIPQLIGLRDEEAMKILEEKSLVGVEGEPQNSDKSAGEVIKVKPFENSIVKKNSTVTLIVSSGTAKVSVPDLKNKTEADAKLSLSDAELTKGTVSHLIDENTPKGQIISQIPLPGESVDSGTSVSFTISDGSLIMMRMVPDMVGMGMTQAEAETALRDAKINHVEIEYVNNESPINDVVIAQSVNGDSQIPDNQTLKITINKTNSNYDQNQSTTTDSITTTPDSIQSTSTDIPVIKP